MSPLLIPPLFRLAIGAAGAAAVVHWVVKEVRRANAEFDRVSSAPTADAMARQAMPTLRRDPQTGDWRLM